MRVTPFGGLSQERSLAVSPQGILLSSLLGAHWWGEGRGGWEDFGKATLKSSLAVQDLHISSTKGILRESSGGYFRD